MAWVLVVEDDRADADILQRACDSVMPGVTFETTRTAEEGLERLEAAAASGQLPGFVLFDIHLPGMSGLRLAQAIKTRLDLGGVPLAVMTGSQLERDRTSARRSGADHFFVKPADFLQLQDEWRAMRDLWIRD